MLPRFTRYFAALVFLMSLVFVSQPAWATLPTPSQPILVVQDSTSADPYQNYVSELMTTEGLNGFQIAQLTDLTAAFLSNYDLVVLPHLTLTSAQATLFQNYVNAGGTLVGFRPDLQLASVFGVSSLGSTLAESWLKIDTSTQYGAGLDSTVMRYHGTADLYTLNGASALATLYSNTTTATASPAATIYTFGQGKAILFSFDLTQSIVLMRQGNPAWAGYPNTHDGYSTMRASQMFMDQGSGQFWNDLGDGALNDIPQADIQLRLFSNAAVLTNSAKRPLPRFWYFPNQSSSLLLMTGDHHGDVVDNSLDEISTVESFGGKFSEFLWYPFGAVDVTQVNTWLANGHAMGIHFDDSAEVDASGVAGSSATWTGMQSVLNNALLSFGYYYPDAPAPITTRDHVLLWLSRNSVGSPDQTAQAKLFQAAGIQLDTTYTAFPNRWGYMTGSGMPMKFLDTATGAVIPVFEQATQFEDDIQLSASAYSMKWNLAAAQTHYQKALSDSIAKYNTVVTVLFHPDHWSNYSSYAQTLLQYAQSNSISMTTTAAWLQFWQGRAATTLSMPSFASNTLTFTATGSPSGLTLLVPNASGNNVVSIFLVDGAAQSFAVQMYQGVAYASVILTAGTHNVSVSYTAAGKILGQISPSVAGSSTSVQVQGGSITESGPVAADGTYVLGPLPPGTYTVTPSSSSYTFLPTSRSVTVGSVDVTGINFTATANVVGQTIFTTQTPALTNNSDGAGADYELGTSFTSSADGEITSVRFWKAPSESGPHVGKIWSSTGTLLASATFTNETASGWQQQDLSAPLAIAANTIYVVSVNTANSFYVATSAGLASQVVNGNLRSVVGNNGRLGSPGSFPTNSFNSGNYFRDIVFLPFSSTPLASVSMNPSSVAGGTSSTGTVTLVNPAPSGGAVVTLASDSPSATVPNSVTVAQGLTTANFAVSTSAVAAVTTANILGSFNGFQSAALVINPPVLSSVSLNPTTVAGGESSTGTAILNGPAPAGGVVVTLTDDSGFAITPPSVTVPEGASGATFTVDTVAVGTNTTATITGTFGVSQTAALTIDAPTLTSVTLNPATVAGGNDSTGTVTLSSAAPTGGVSVTLSSDSGAATVAGNVTVLGGATTATFTVDTVAVGTNTTATITGNFGVSQTAALTIDAPTLSGVTLNPATLVGGSSSTGTVTLSSAAPTGGVSVTLSSDSGAATVPASVTVLGGATTATFTVATVAVGTNTTATITGTFGVAQTAALTIDAPTLSGVALNPGTLVGGSSSTGTVTLSSAAPTGGVSVTLSSDSGAATVAGNVTVLGGATTATFTVDTVAVGTNTTATITGNFGVSQTAALTIDAPTLSGVTLNPATLVGGSSSTGTVTLSSAAPTGGVSVTLSSDSGAATVAGNVTVLGGATTATFTVDTVAVGTNTTATITGTFGVSQTAALTIDAPTLSGVTLNPATLVGGSSSTGTVTLSSAAPTGGVSVTLSSDNGAATVAGNVTVLGGATTATFTVATVAVGTNTTATITGTFGVSQTAALTIDAPTLSGVALNPATLVGGSSSTGTVTLSSAAPTGGVSVTLSSDSGAATVPASVTVLGGATTATFTVDTVAVGTNTTATITGNFGVSQTAALTIHAPTLSGVALNPATLVGGNSSTGTVTLSSAAPTGGVSVTLSSDSGTATVPASVTVLGGATTATFTVTTAAVGTNTTATITGNFGVSQTAELVISAPALASLSFNPTSLAGGTSSTGTIVLTGPAPAGGIAVVLGSNNGAATVPASVAVGAGAATAIFIVTTTPVVADTTATITGNFNGTSAAQLTINAPIVTALSLNPSSVPGGTSSTGTVTLGSVAPTGGVPVTITSDDQIVSGILGVYSQSDLPQAGSVDWGSFGPEFTNVPSGSVAPVSGIPGVNMTLTSNTGLAMQVVSNCDFGGNCGWYGNFSPGATLLWMNGTYYPDSRWWDGNGPLTVQFNSPQRGIGFQVMPDEVGVFTTTLCAYKADSTLLGCVPFDGNATSTADGSALFIGLYDDAQEISKVTIDSGGVIYPHDFAISQVFVTSTRRQFMPATVIVPAGAKSATFPLSPGPVSATTNINITATSGAMQSAVLTVEPAAISAVAVTPSSVLGGTALVGTATLNGIASVNGTVVTLSADNPVSSGIQTVTSQTNLPNDVLVKWTQLGAVYDSIPSGTTLPLGGPDGLTITASTSNSQDAMILANCPTKLLQDCAWAGNFVPGEPLLWVGGRYLDTVNWTNWEANGPLTLTMSAPQRGFGFNIMADEAGPFTGTVCAYNASNVQLGCNPFVGNGAPLAGGTNGFAIFVGVYDDTQEISKVTVDAGGVLYPHDFAIGHLVVATSRRMVPASVKVQAGATSATFPINTDTVSTTTTVQVTGNYLGTQAGTLIINPAVLSSVSVSPSTVLGGDSPTGTVTFSTPAPTGGAVVTLSSDNPAVVVPASVTVPAGATTATFTISTTGVSSVASATISAAYSGTTRTATLTVAETALASVSLSPASLIGGSGSTGTVILSGIAPSGGAIVALSSNSGAATVPASVSVASGATTATFTVTTSAVGANTTANITGNYNGTQTAQLAISAPTINSVSLSPNSVVGGSSSTGTVTLGSAAPTGGVSVALSSNSGAATVPPSVTVAGGATTATFTVTTSAVGANTTATITSSFNGTQTAQLAISAPSLSSVTLNPGSVTGGNTSTGTVTLTSLAPTGGAVVTLSSNNGAATVPANVTVPAGATTVTFTVSTTVVGSVASATITGTYNGTGTAILTINPPALASVAMNPASVVGGSSSTGTVTLNAVAPAGGTLVTLSDNSASSTTPASVTVVAGATTATFTVTTVAVGSNTTSTISATLLGVTQTATLTITAPTLSNLTMNPTSVNGGASSTGTVTLSSAAPTGGAVVTLSDDSAFSTTPASVTVAAGATTATFTVTTTGVASATTVTITGTFNAAKTATLTINPPTLSSVTVNPTAVVGGNGSTGTVTLGSIAPAGGALVTLSSNNAAATVPASVTVAAGATTATFAITTSGVSAATPVTITGIYGVSKTATLTVNPAALTSVAMSPTAVTGGTSSTGTVTLTGFAPTAGAVVTLSSNNANATTPASVTVPAGSATATFTVTTATVSAAVTATITAVYSGVTKTATLTVNPAALVSVSMSPATVPGGTSSTGTVTLDSPAPTGGASVTLSDNSASTTTPASVTVPAGATTATFTVTSVSVATATSVTITATRNGVTQTATLTLNPPQVASITLNPTTVVGGSANSTATITLTAPATGTTAQRRVTLTSSNTAAATVPANVTVASGATTATFTVTSLAVAASTTSSITATMNSGAQSATLTVNP